MASNFLGSAPLRLLSRFVRFLRFGMLAFGGPVAQIAMLRQALVQEERWVEPARFNRLLAVMKGDAGAGGARAACISA